MGDKVLYSKNKLTELNFPELTSIGQQAFYGCTAVTSINVPKLKTIGHYGMQYLNKLRTISLPAIENIGQQAFRYCTSLKYMVLPASLRLINSNVFNDCTALEAVIFLGTTPPTMYNDTLKNAAALTDIYVGWEYHAESHEPWSAPATATIHYRSEGWMDELETILSGLA